MAKLLTLRRVLVIMPVYLLAFWLLGFGYYYARLQKPPPPEAVRADAIIVLTGGAGRLQAGLTLLAKKSGARLLISGVHPSVVRAELSSITGADPALFDCCVDLGRAAQDTFGNARESRGWVQIHGFKTVILVTADYHMPRSLIVFHHAMPGVRFVAFPVDSGQPLHLLAKEYTKYLFTLFGQLLPEQAYEQVT